ncbi:MAG TPA: DHA2 family efflux MFS transporter permease subunit [Trebonia sp.]|nr:DHA2 family efflux MFS transporter permease subunit [Trebonia sp.]
MTTYVHPRRAQAVPGPAAPGRRWLALAVLCVTLLMVTLDTTVLNVALPTLVRDLHATTTQLQWIVDAYVLVFAGLLLVAGSVADRAGRKRVFCAGLLAFAAGSAWAAFSGSTDMLIAARASMGIGGAIMMPSTLSLITSIFTDTGERQRAIGLWAGTSGLGIALGPIVGGALLARFWWGSVFLINVPIALAGFALAVPLVPESRSPAPRRPDYAGAVLSIAGLGLLLWSLIEAPARGWTSPRVLAAGTGGLVVLALFVLWEGRTSHPMLNLALFRERALTGAVCSMAMVAFGLFGTLFLLTQYLQFSLGYSALAAGIRVLPAAGTIAVVAPLGAFFLRVTTVRYAVATGLACIAAGLWQLSGATVASTYVSILPGLILLGLGVGLAMPAATESVMGSLPGTDTGVGAATNGAFMQTGGALGVAVIGSLLNTRYTDNISAILAPHHVPAAVLGTIRGSLGGALEVAARLGGQFGAELAAVARGAFVSGMDLGLLTGALVAFAGCAVALAVLPDGRRTAARPVPKANETGTAKSSQDQHE